MCIYVRLKFDFGWVSLLFYLILKFQFILIRNVKYIVVVNWQKDSYDNRVIFKFVKFLIMVRSYKQQIESEFKCVLVDVIRYELVFVRDYES